MLGTAGIFKIKITNKDQLTKCCGDNGGAEPASDTANSYKYDYL